MIRFTRSRGKRAGIDAGRQGNGVLALVLAATFMMALVALTACGDTPSNTLPEPTGSGQYRVLNLMPLPASVDVVSGSTALGTALAFGQGGSYVTMSAGDYFIEFNDAANDTLIVAATVGVTDLLKASAIAYGCKYALGRYALSDAVDDSVADNGDVLIQFFHVALGVGKLNVADITDGTSSDLRVTLGSDMSFGGVGTLRELPAGVRILGIDTNASTSSWEIQYTLPTLTAGDRVRIFGTAKATAADTMSANAVGADSTFVLIIQRASGITRWDLKP
jgi:hypothetical protein